MQSGKCSHRWEMVNVASGLIVMKKCFHCGKVSTCFTFHNKPPLEPCHEEEHFWNFVQGDEALHFDLKCRSCGTLVKLDELVGLMVCTGCDQRCEVDMLRRKLEQEGTQVWVALSGRPVDERKQLPPEKLAALQEYISQHRESSKSKIKIVSHEMVKSIDNCYAEVVRDNRMLFATCSESK